VGVDNWCTACISDNTKHFIGALRLVKQVIRGFGISRTMDIMTGTIQWKWQDENGLEHAFKIPNSFYITSGQVCLLSPQHWVQSAKYGKAWEQTDSRNCTLYWRDDKHKLVLPLGTHDNVATLQLSPGYTKYEAFCTKAKIPNDYDRDPIIAMDTGVVSDDEDDSDGKEDQWKPLVHEREEEGIRNVDKGVEEQQQEADNAPEGNQQNTTDFDLNGPVGSKRNETHGLSSYLWNYLPQRLLLRQTITRGTTEQQ
jgi:hypothetical protein